MVEFKLINKKDIKIPDWLPRKPGELIDEDEQNLSDSIVSLGQINPITIRIKDGKYELIAGSRRLFATKDEKIMARIDNNISDLAAMVMVLAENSQRKGLDINKRNAFIYATWLKGKESGEFSNLIDFAKQIGMSADKLNIILIGEKERFNSKQTCVIQKASSLDLYATKSLSDIPEVREKLLELEQKKNIGTRAMENIVSTVKTAVDKGLDKDSVIKVIDAMSPSEEKIIDKDNIDVETQPRKIADALDILKSSPEDVKEKWKKGEISLETAKDLNKFETQEARDQVAKEIKKIEESKKIAQEVHDWDRKFNVDQRLKQQQEIKEKGETQKKTRFDDEYKKKFEKKSNRDQVHDEGYIERYQRLSSYTLETFAHFHPKNFRIDENKKTGVEIIKNLYTLYHDVLVEIGEIKEAKARDSKTDDSKNDKRKNIKYLEANNV